MIRLFGLRKNGDYMNLPQKYLDTMKDMLGDEFDAYLDSFNDSRY